MLFLRIKIVTVDNFLMLPASICISLPQLLAETTTFHDVILCYTASATKPNLPLIGVSTFPCISRKSFWSLAVSCAYIFLYFSKFQPDQYVSEKGPDGLQSICQING